MNAIGSPQTISASNTGTAATPASTWRRPSRSRRRSHTLSGRWESWKNCC